MYNIIKETTIKMFDTEMNEMVKQFSIHQLIEQFSSKNNADLLFDIMKNYNDYDFKLKGEN